jgi:hypothetical protein
MAIQIQGNIGVICEVDGTTYRALRVNIRPVDYGMLGSYRCSLYSGTIAAGFSPYGDVWQCRWGVSPQLALIWGVSLSGLAGGTSAFTTGYCFAGLTMQRAWTVDGSGGTTAVFTGNRQKLRASMASSLMTMRIANTSSLTRGTSTADSQGIGNFMCAVGTTPSFNYTNGQVNLYGSMSLEDGGNPAPVVLAQNEGIAFQVAVPGSGTWGIGVTALWSEVSSY